VKLLKPISKNFIFFGSGIFLVLSNILYPLEEQINVFLSYLAVVI